MAKAPSAREVSCRKNTGFRARNKGSKLRTLTSCVTLGKLLNFSEPPIPHLQNGNNIYLVGRTNKVSGIVSRIDNGWHLEDRRGMLIFPTSTLHPHHPPFNMTQHCASAVRGYVTEYEV